MNDHGMNNIDNHYSDGYMEPEEEWEREGLLDPAWEKQQKKLKTDLLVSSALTGPQRAEAEDARAGVRPPGLPARPGSSRTSWRLPPPRSGFRTRLDSRKE
ncbi:Alpha-actinin-1 [Frankliniella fusca]|uniref:Alpha-actinin-1 n=1 Tax=Frankliniella fusca TaxID=407009 RepID=A0AAE1H3I0_9NEOP|nr:Alpha-actinin-1 [Frankliniella fusca]